MLYIAWISSPIVLKNRLLKPKNIQRMVTRLDKVCCVFCDRNGLNGEGLLGLEGRLLRELQQRSTGSWAGLGKCFTRFLHHTRIRWHHVKQSDTWFKIKEDLISNVHLGYGVTNLIDKRLNYLGESWSFLPNNPQFRFQNDWCSHSCSCPASFCVSKEVGDCVYAWGEEP